MRISKNNLARTTEWAAAMGVFLLVPTLLACPRSFAQDADARDDVARTLFEAGRERYDVGEWSAAIELWERSFALCGRPTLLFNLATGYSQLGRFDEAIRRYEQYLLFVGNQAERQGIEDRIADLRARIARNQSSTENDGPSHDTTDPSDERLQHLEGNASEPSDAMTTGDSTEHEAEERRRRPWTWSLLGIGAGLGITSAIVWSTARNRHEELAATCGSSAIGCTPSQIGQVSRRTSVARTSLAFSITGLTAAVVLFFLEDRNAERPLEFTGSGVSGQF